MIYTEIVPGDQVKITVGPKGFGSENMSQIRMFKPSAGLQGIKDFILEVVETAGPNPCPPMVVGVGIGGTFDKCALLAKKALMRPLDTQNPDPFYADLEKEMLEKTVFCKIKEPYLFLFARKRLGNPAVYGKFSRSYNIHQYKYHQINKCKFFYRKRIIAMNNEECHTHRKYHRNHCQSV